MTQTPTSKQLENIWLLSDTVLYPEATAFMHRLLREQGCKPLPTRQVAGLLSIAESNQYNELHDFVVHQRGRNWQEGQRDIPTFYQALEEKLTNIQQRLRGDFHLLPGGNKPGRLMTEEEVALMAVLAREFIQHLMAENGRLAAQNEGERRQPPPRGQFPRPGQQAQQPGSGQQTQQRTNRR